ncbi:hypothetical protein BAUCODRAFT_436504 [Baudoinia panamericana UAMH 10762]|uniref:Uncharacterized protein n=1 Tax=Baudoinia panamericana (strain UAMH 10762) TaxID=717646 RepID=M2MZK8_BAUPA|nr:uncharacterized protein BAUCODRAFT_436504 [Baudoinia panamericana UAMH 10762]EMC97048.1 hypothetical protein BAUCODRAFT_436504 [Baudoinia panamericana UAMH 10762]
MVSSSGRRAAQSSLSKSTLTAAFCSAQNLLMSTLGYTCPDTSTLVLTLEPSLWQRWLRRKSHGSHSRSGDTAKLIRRAPTLRIGKA